MQIEVKPVDPPKEYILRLNQNELNLISMLVGRTGGSDGESGWRKIINELHDKMYPHSKYSAFDSIFDEIGYVKQNPPIKPK